MRPGTENIRKVCQSAQAFVEILNLDYRVSLLFERFLNLCGSKVARQRDNIRFIPTSTQASIQCADLLALP